MEKTWRGYLFAVCVVVFLGATVWSAGLSLDETRDQASRRFGLGGMVLFSILAGAAAAQVLKPWLKAREPGGPTSLTR
jgi:hypothetical protein